MTAELRDLRQCKVYEADKKAYFTLQITLQIGI